MRKNGNVYVKSTLARVKLLAPGSRVVRLFRGPSLVWTFGFGFCNIAGCRVMLFYCRFCEVVSDTVKSHADHSISHRNLSQKIHCGYGKKCRWILPSANAFAVHVTRSHTPASLNNCTIDDVQDSLLNSNAQFECSVGFCRKLFHHKRNFMGHLKNHFQNGVRVPCTQVGCISEPFASLSSLTGHISKFHKNRRSDPSSSCVTEPVQDESAPLDIAHNNQSDSVVDVNNHLIPDIEQDTSVLSKEQYLISLAQFYQKLAYKHLVPESTVQVISEELKYLLLQNNKLFLNDVKAALHKCNVSTDVAQDVIDLMLPENNVLSGCRTLRSNHMRKKAFRNFFTFVEPQRVDLGNGNFFYYVPVPETIKALFKNKSWNFELSFLQPSEDGVLRDFTDGRSFLDNEFFKSNPSALKLIIYQDGFELVCPIGPAHNLEHKLIGVYMAFADLPSDIRFQKDSIQLVALCREKDFDHKIVYGKIVDDLLKVQRDGIDVPKVGVVKAGLAFIAGDNLGSHCLAGLVKNFSRSIYFCRYCMLQRSLFNKQGGEVRTFQRRTPDLYDNSCNHMSRNQNNSKKSHQGVKYDSEFNQIEGFHVCSNGLPPCLAHDLLEGIIAHDLKLFIQFFAEEEWFTLDELNDMIKLFPYSTEDKRDRPCKINKLEKAKLAGGAWQLWMFLRLFPLIVRNSVPDFNNIVWKCMLLLREVTLITVSPEIHISQLPYLQSIIEEYLVLRKGLFPTVPLRPKHHYLSHYSEFIYNVGPLIKVWTLRFESKHCFFNEAWKKSGHNSINVLQTLSFKHEYSQCHARSGGNIKVDVVSGGAKRKMHRILYSDVINAELMKCPYYAELEEVDWVTIKGTQYRKGNVLALQHNPVENRLTIGIILLIFEFTKGVFFLVQKGTAESKDHIGAYEMCRGSEFQCVYPDKLLSYYPLFPYVLDNKTYICLKHAFVKQELK